MRTLSPREHRLIAVAILVALILIAVRLIVQPVIDGFVERAAMRESLRQTYVQNERQIASIDRLRRAVEQQRRDLARLVVAGRDPVTTGDVLRDRVQRTVEAAGGEFRGAEDATGTPGWLRIRGTARLTTAQLADVLARLQNTAPYLVVEALTINADPTVVDGKINPLETVIDVAIPLAAPKRA